MGENEDILEVLYNLRYIQERPKDETENFFTGIRDDFIRSAGSLLGYDDDVLRDWGTGKLEGRDLLDKTQATLNQIALIAEEEGGIDALIFNEEDRVAFEKSGWESAGGIIGGFAPTLVDLLITGAMLESGVGTVAGVAPVISKSTNVGANPPMIPPALSHPLFSNATLSSSLKIKASIPPSSSAINAI
jgi:hypothetical protein